MRIIPYKIYSGAENMRTDQDLLDEAVFSQSREFVLRFYGWEKPTLTLGRNQNVSGIDEDYCQKKDIPVIRRITGGRAVLHNKELTYSFITPVDSLKKGNSIPESYKEISQALIFGFENLGINLSYIENKKISVKDPYCMAISSGADLSFEGKKFIGSAQCRKNGYILQHGSILFDVDDELTSGVFFGSSTNKDVMTLKQIDSSLTKDIDFVCNQIQKGFEKKFGVYV